MYSDPHPIENNCWQCHKPLFGRTDKKFCNDTCRNTYNRKAQQGELVDEPGFIRQITQAIRKNRKILERIAAPRQLPCPVSRHLLIEAGFHFKFFTSIRQQKDGSIYYFCFEFGWKETEDQKCILVCNYDQADI
jgi:hypothetical protein